jgi:hypothetical protein
MDKCDFVQISIIENAQIAFESAPMRTYCPSRPKAQIKIVSPQIPPHAWPPTTNVCDRVHNYAMLKCFKIKLIRKDSLEYLGLVQQLL